jgi:hypothetical protein
MPRARAVALRPSSVESRFEALCASSNTGGILSVKDGTHIAKNCAAIAPGAVAGDRIERVLQGRASTEHKTLEEERAAAMNLQSLKRFVDPKDIAALILFLTSDAGKSISGQVLPIDNDAQTSA